MKELKRKLILMLIAANVVMLAGAVALADEPQQSTTGPTPSMAVVQRDIESDFLLLGVPPVSPVVIAGVPDYLWRHGCGSTAVGNVIGYYDTHGYNDLITGDANSQTNDVNQAMASGGDSSNPNPPGSEQHYEDYARPEDFSPGPLLTDDYITLGRIAHTNDSIGDYQDTSKSTRANYYGWSWSNDIGPSFVGYINQQNATYTPSYIEYSPVSGNALTWAVLTTEINNNRPMVFLVDTDGDNNTDHFVCVVGYDASTNQYGCHDSWAPAGVRWETFQAFGNYQPWSIWGGWSFRLGQQAEVTKYEQLPDMTYYGMDIRCDRKGTQLRVLADDFPCTRTGPITKVRIWGSWKGDIKGTINNIHLSIHSDDPIGPGGTDPYNTFSKPDLLLWSGNFSSSKFTETLFFQSTSPYEWWWDPNAQPIPNNDSQIWQYEIRIDANQAFVQDGNLTNPKIYWLDAYADINSTPTAANFGWKTSEMHWNDDAVRSIHNGNPWIELRYPPPHPRMGDSIDLSFAIITGHTEPNTEPNVKWLQNPDLSENGMDVMASDPLILADDFECRKTTKITDITIWGSWKYDILPSSGASVPFTLSIHKDIPANDPCYPHEWSMPGDVLWQGNFMPSEVSIEKAQIYEGWYNPYYYEYIFPGDYTCWKYVFHIPEANAFCQQGEPNKPIVYWLDVQAHPGLTGGAEFGWKSSINHWNDDAVWAYGVEPYVGWWNELRYPQGHELYPQSIDLAFAIDGNKPCTQAEDFGDAPDGIAAPGYPTLLINNGARHTIDGVTFMGVLVDAEVDGQPTANADGDDLNPPIGFDDEDGVVIPPLMRGQTVTINVTASVPGALDAWIDFNADGSWAQAGDQIAAALPLVAGANPVTFVVPATSTLGQTYARFRFSTAGGLQPFGAASNGEVEDYAVFIEEPPLDLGDAPNTYPTLIASGGPSHVAIGPMLGALRDTEPDGQPSANCTLDDTTTSDDEDGVTNLIATSLIAGSVTVNASAPCLLNAWVDFTNDGDFADAGEQILTNSALVAGNNIKTFAIPVGAVRETLLVSRWRVNTAGGLSYGGSAVDGEVEDHKIGPYISCMKDPTTPVSIRTDWVKWNRPRCWCYERNCRGDADGSKTGSSWCAAADLNLFKSCYLKADTILKNIVMGGIPCICTDFDHIKTGAARVAASDLNAIKSCYLKPVTSVPVCPISPNYYFWCTPPTTCPANF